MTFNKTENTIFIFLACVVIIASAVVVWHSRQARNENGRERARLAAQIASLKSRLQTSESDLAQAKTDWNTERAMTTDADTSAMASRTLAQFRTQYTAYMERVKNGDPKFLKNYQEGLQFNINSMSEIFSAKEHMTPDQIEKFKKAIAQRIMDRDDLRFALESQGLSADDPSGLPIKQEADDAFKKAMEDIVGPDGYARYEDYQKRAGAYDMMARYAANSAINGSPLTSDQVEQMVDYIAKNNPDYNEGKPVNPRQIDWDAVDEQARKIMTPEQFDLFTHTNPYVGGSSFSNTRWGQKVDRAVDAIVEEAKKQNTGTPAPAQ